MSQQCWKPPSPMAAGLPSGWSCHPVGPVWSSTSGCCWVLCAAVSLNPDLVAHVSNDAQHPPAMSLSAFDTASTAERDIEDDTDSALQEGVYRNGDHRVQGSKTHSAEQDQSEGLVPCWYVKNWTTTCQWHEVKPLMRTWLRFGNTLIVWIAKGVRTSEVPLWIKWELH